MLFEQRQRWGDEALGEQSGKLGKRFGKMVLEPIQDGGVLSHEDPELACKRLEVEAVATFRTPKRWPAF